MAMMYKLPVSVYSNSKGELAVKPDTEGKFTFANVDELYAKMLAYSKEHKMPIRLYKPKGKPNCTAPVLLTDKWGKPYLALLEPQKAPSKAVITKLF
jgi:hypothetical protein